ncbi:MAG: ABC-F family ATP-binding cassette domain-containing protein [Acidimicrobiales bacterium]
MSAPLHPSATLLASRLTLARGDQLVLDDVALTVAPRDRIGVVGANGVGKSTLLGVLGGSIRPDQGAVRLDPPAATVGLLAQEHAHAPGESVRALLARLTGVAGAETELMEAARSLERDEPVADHRYAVALDRFVALSDGDLDARIDAALEDLGVGGIGDHDAATLSGGQSAKVALAAIVLSRFDLTLLDEPTNDLDFNGLDRLSAFVETRAGGVVVVSHDRDFLRRTVTDVFELGEHDHRGRRFGGGWDAYLAQRETDRRHAEEAFRSSEAQRAELKARAGRERDWATHGVARERRQRDHDKTQRDFRINRTEQLASRARRTQRALEALEVVEKPWEGWQLNFRIEQAARAGAVVARLSDAVVERGDFRLGPVDLEIGWAERVGVVGPNGSGKSTLVAALLGRVPLTVGERWMGPSVVVGELGQDRSGIGSGDSIVARITAAGMTSTEARALLAKFGLRADQVGRPSASLSPGERTRAELARFQGIGVNFLVLDEPTNHLDLPAIEQLESALEHFEGTLLLVSHDRQLLDAVELHRTIELGP